MKQYYFSMYVYIKNKALEFTLYKCKIKSQTNRKTKCFLSTLRFELGSQERTTEALANSAKKPLGNPQSLLNAY
jgi:hypothetical protein